MDAKRYNDTKTKHIRIAGTQDRTTQAPLDERSLNRVNVISAVRSYERLFQELLESVYDAVLITDLDGRVVKTNGRAIDFFDYTRLEFFYLNILDLISNADDELLRVTAESLTDNRHVFIEAYCQRKDGSFFPADITVNAIHLSDDGQLCFFVRNISARKETEEKLKDAQRELVRTAHGAGMATIATGVLHDVGNLLNSINVSCSVIGDVVQRSAVGRLAGINSRLAGRADEFSNVVADSEFAKLPEILARLTDLLASEHSALAEEVESLANKVNMIKDVVQTQQQYAKIGQFKQAVDLDAIVEDALAIQKTSLDNMSIKIEKKLVSTSPVQVQKAELLHVLVNLITNATDALAGNNRHDRIMAFTTGATDDEAYIEVRDNGIGIDAEDLTRIFTHGFSTKANGHGFGLHSSANFMTEMDGRITAESGGPGQGAVFTLWFPINEELADDD